MESIARHLPAAIPKADNPTTASLLLLASAEIAIRRCRWDQATAHFESVLTDPVFYRNAIEGIVEIHAIRALLALKKGFEHLERFKRHFAPQMEITLHGNDRKMQEGAAKSLRRLRKPLAQIVSEKRRRELGLTAES